MLIGIQQTVFRNVITLPAYKLVADTENPHCGNIPTIAPNKGPNFPDFLIVCLTFSLVLCSMYSIIKYVINNTITNFTANPIRRLDLEFQASYDDKIDKVKKVINEVLDNCEYVLEDKTRLVNVVKHGDSSVVYIVQVWVKKENYLPAKYNLNEAVKEAFDKNKIEIPYMQIDIRNR